MNLYQFAGAQPFLENAAFVNEGSALSIPAFYKACQLVSNAVGSLPLGYETPTGEALPVPDLVKRPNIQIRNFEFWSSAVATCALHGDYFAKVDRVNGIPVQLTPVHPSVVVMVEDRRTGELMFIVNGSEAVNRSDMLHVKAFHLAGALRGIPLLLSQKRTLGQSLDGMENVTRGFRSGGTPTGVLTASKDMGLAKMEEIIEKWQAKMSQSSRVPIGLPEWVKFEPLSSSNKEQMTVELTNMTNIAAAWIWGLSASDIDSAPENGQTQLYANINDNRSERLNNAILPWVLRFEQALDDLLPGDGVVKFKTDQLLRLNEEGRATVATQQATRLKVLVEAGIMTVDEARSEIGMPNAA